MTHTFEGTLFAFESSRVLPRLAINARHSRNLLTMAATFGADALAAAL